MEIPGDLLAVGFYSQTDLEIWKISGYFLSLDFICEWDIYEPVDD